MIRSISRCASVLSHTGSSPTVVPPLGSVAISGTGRNGAVEGLSQRARPVGDAGGGPAGGVGPVGSCVPGGTGTGCCGTLLGTCARSRAHGSNSSTAVRSVRMVADVLTTGGRSASRQELCHALQQPRHVARTDLAHVGDAKDAVREPALTRVDHEAGVLQRIVQPLIMDTGGQAVGTQ